MKLLRLSTTDNNCIFNTSFNEDIILKPNSKIALQNISFETVNTSVIINSLNNVINFQLTAATPKTITLNEETYTSVNFQDLFDDITNKMNKSLELTGKQIGTQYLAGVNTDGRVSIAYKRGPYAWTNTLYANTANVSNTAGGIIDTGNTPNTVDTTNKYFMGTKFGKGCSVWRVRLRKLIDNASGLLDNGFEMGLSKDAPSIWSASANMTDAQRFYSISVERPTAFYEYRNDGTTPTISAFTPEKFASATRTNNDVLEISLNLGKIEGRIYQDTGGTRLLFSVDYNINDDLYPYIIFRGNSNFIRVDNLRQTVDPFQVTLSNHIEGDIIEESILGASPPQPITNATINTLNLSYELSQYLGYYNLNNTISGVDADFISNALFTKTINNDSFAIISDSIQLDSYDDTVKGRLNVLATVPKSDSAGVVVYEPNQTYFIDISNNKEIILRDMRFRVLNNGLDNITVRGVSVMTLLID
jgi:hypothetical protein